MDGSGRDRNDEETELYVDFVEITERVPKSVSEDRLEAAVLRSFLHRFNNLLYVIITNSRDALGNLVGDHGAYRRIKDLERAANDLDSAVKNLQRLVEGAAPFRGAGTILVVEDGDEVRSLLVKTLESYGYTVFGVSGGHEAIDTCDGYPAPIHLVLADVGIEPMDGYELVRRILLKRPNMRAIYMSGNLPDHARAMPGTEFPMKGDELARCLRDRVRQMLNRP